MIVKASTRQKEFHTGKFPLFGSIMVGNMSCNIEDLRGYGNVSNFSLVAPKGYLFSSNESAHHYTMTLEEIEEISKYDSLREECLNVS